MDIKIIGSPREREYTEEIKNKIDNSRVQNIAGSTNIDELIQVISNTKFMISNDTGPMHIAFSTQTPIVCLFGPCSPEQYGSSKHAYIIYKNVYCSPCVHDFAVSPCKGNNVCMKQITVDEVLLKVEQLISNCFIN